MRYLSSTLAKLQFPCLHVKPCFSVVCNPGFVVCSFVTWTSLWIYCLHLGSDSCTQFWLQIQSTVDSFSSKMKSYMLSSGIWEILFVHMAWVCWELPTVPLSAVGWFRRGCQHCCLRHYNSVLAMTTTVTTTVAVSEIKQHHKPLNCCSGSAWTQC